MIKKRDLVFKKAAIISALTLAACSHEPPLTDYTLARTALEMAQKSGGNRYAPSFFHKAEEAYRIGEAKYKDNNFEEAKELFVISRDYAEKAENSARLQRFQTGEVDP